MIQIFWSFL